MDMNCIFSLLVPVPPEIQHVKKSVDQQAGSAMVVVYWRVGLKVFF